MLSSKKMRSHFEQTIFATDQIPQTIEDKTMDMSTAALKAIKIAKLLTPPVEFFFFLITNNITIEITFITMETSCYFLEIKNALLIIACLYRRDPDTKELTIYNLVKVCMQQL